MHFSSIQELMELVPALDSCRREPSQYINPVNGKFAEDPKRYDIVNLTTGDRSAVVSDRYQEYQHSDVISLLTKALGKAQIEAAGTVENNHDSISIKMSFTNIKPINEPRTDNPEPGRHIIDKERGFGDISVGARFTNSYNKQNSVRGSGWFVRLACTNGMTIRKMIPEMSFNERHTRSIIQELPLSIDDFITGLLSRTKYIEKVIGIAAVTPVTFTSREQRLQTMAALVDHKKSAELIDKQLGDTLTPSKWDIYNAITYVGSHEQIGETAKTRLEDVSERVLSEKYTIFPAVVA